MNKQWLPRIIVGAIFGCALIAVHHYHIKPDELASSKDVLYGLIGTGSGVWRPKPKLSDLDPKAPLNPAVSAKIGRVG